MHTSRDYHAATVGDCDQDRRCAVPDRSFLTQNVIMSADALGQVSLDISSSCHPR
jgi:ribosomal protein L31